VKYIWQDPLGRKVFDIWRYGALLYRLFLSPPLLGRLNNSSQQVKPFAMLFPIFGLLKRMTVCKGQGDLFGSPGLDSQMLREPI
jgi:hypothetical protein